MHRPRNRVALICLFAAVILPSPTRAQGTSPAADAPSPIGKGQRVVVVMIDGFGVNYLEQSPMPVLKGLMAKGLSRTVRGVMPSVTNVNNASICCGTWPEVHGITGNSFFDEASDRTEYMEMPSTSGRRPCSRGRLGKGSSRRC